MNTTTSEQIGSRSIGGFAYGLGISIAAFIVFTIITYASYKCKRPPPTPAVTNLRHRPATYADSTTDDDDDDDHRSSSITICIQRTNGLDQATLASFPELTYAQVEPPKAAGGGCAICLADYKDGDSLRLLPDCGHVFHLKCVDLWLARNASCPICRYSPLQGGVQKSAPVAAAI